MEELLNIVRALAASHILLFGALLLKAYPNHQAAKATGFFVICLFSYLVIDFRFQELGGWKWIFLLPTLSLPYSFWIVSKAYFDDDFRLKKWMIGLLGLTLLILWSMLHLRIHYKFNNALDSVAMLVPHLMTIIFIILGIIEAARNYSDDLVVSRHRFRLVFMVATSILMVLTVMTEVSFQNEVPGIFNLGQKIAILIMIYYFCFDLLQFKSNFFETAEKETPQSTEIPETDPQLISQLMHLMEDQNIYQTEGLTIRQLAERMEVKEYKLRQAINKHLGFRNFNEFLNSYRIEDAKAILTKRENRNLTILEIAYDLGYASLAPFNKAFKKATGVTPTEFRRNSGN